VLCNSTNDRGEVFSQPCGFWRSYYRLDMDVEAACANVTYVEIPGVPSRVNNSIPLVFQQVGSSRVCVGGRGGAGPAAGASRGADGCGEWRGGKDIVL
jgi:hypothetical protein